MDAWKLCQLCRRPDPRGGEDIGSWLSILELTSTIAVLVNAGIVAFTSLNTVSLPWSSRIWIFITMSAGVLILKGIISVLVPDVPVRTEVQMRRQKHFVDKVLHNIPDEDNQNLLDIVKSDGKYEIRINDDDPL